MVPKTDDTAQADGILEAQWQGQRQGDGVAHDDGGIEEVSREAA